MKWTTEIPSREGWYFERTQISGAPYVNVVYVSCDSRGRWWAGAAIGSRGFRVSADRGVEWAGPIPEPEGDMA